ncbi:AAA family ATPase [Halobaculum sp. D14]|uniref:AAA family ATPase n=1 Tax=Halobaculum sp. D14 TaxID=3421642 RepID=UPI003EBA9DF9
MFVLLCGLPASGKTTLATGLQRRLADAGYTFELLHSDDYRRRTYERMYERVAGSDADWILDGTFHRREWRVRFQTLRNVYVVWVDAAVETCVARNRARDEPISERGVYAVDAAFEPPRADLTLDTDELTVEAALDRLEAAAVDWLDAERGD